MRLTTIVCTLVLIAVTIGYSATRLRPTWSYSSHWTNFSEAGPLQLNGNASFYREGVRLTDNAYSQVGSLFRKAPIDARDWETSFSFQLQGPFEHADGITLCIQNDRRGALALGSAGGYLGYGRSDAWETPGIPKSFALEFDNYYNPEFKDLRVDHIGIDTDASVVSNVAVASPVSLSGRLVNVKVTYYDKVLEVYIAADGQNPEKPFLSYPIDIPAIIGSEIGYIGFTGATATYVQTSDVTRWTFANPKRVDAPGDIVPILD